MGRQFRRKYFCFLEEGSLGEESFGFIGEGSLGEGSLGFIGEGNLGLIGEGSLGSIGEGSFSFIGFEGENLDLFNDIFDIVFLEEIFREGRHEDFVTDDPVEEFCLSSMFGGWY